MSKNPEVSSGIRRKPKVFFQLYKYSHVGITATKSTIAKLGCPLYSSLFYILEGRFYMHYMPTTGISHESSYDSKSSQNMSVWSHQFFMEENNIKRIMKVYSLISSTHFG